MKNLLYGMVLSMSCLSAYSQGDTIRVTDYDLKDVEIKKFYAFELDKSFLPELGEDVVWDYSNISADLETLTIGKDMEDAPSPNFENANLAGFENIDGEEDWTYLNKNETGVYYVGYEGASDAETGYIKFFPESVYYGSYDSTTSGPNGGKFASVLEGVGYGTVTTPFGEFTDATLMQTTLYMQSGAVWNKISLGYTWFIKNRYFESALTVDYDPYEDEVTVAWLEPVDISILTKTDPVTVNSTPNTVQTSTTPETPNSTASKQTNETLSTVETSTVSVGSSAATVYPTILSSGDNLYLFSENEPVLPATVRLIAQNGAVVFAQETAESFITVPHGLHGTFIVSIETEISVSTDQITVE